ncbi:unnamed protein product, partial [Prorocentrum cordatum]
LSPPVLHMVVVVEHWPTISGFSARREAMLDAAPALASPSRGRPWPTTEGPGGAALPAAPAEASSWQDGDARATRSRRSQRLYLSQVASRIVAPRGADAGALCSGSPFRSPGRTGSVDADGGASPAALAQPGRFDLSERDPLQRSTSSLRTSGRRSPPGRAAQQLPRAASSLGSPKVDGGAQGAAAAVWAALAAAEKEVFSPEVMKEKFNAVDQMIDEITRGLKLEGVSRKADPDEERAQRQKEERQRQKLELAERAEGRNPQRNVTQKIEHRRDHKVKLHGIPLTSVSVVGPAGAKQVAVVDVGTLRSKAPARPSGAGADGIGGPTPHRRCIGGGRAAPEPDAISSRAPPPLHRRGAARSSRPACSRARPGGPQVKQPSGASVRTLLELQRLRERGARRSSGARGSWSPAGAAAAAAPPAEAAPAAAAGAEVKYLWLDWPCMWQANKEGQREITVDEKAEFDLMLSEVNMLYLGCRVVILLDMTYLSRFWTLYEAWLSQMKPTSTGLKPALISDASRCDVVPIMGANDAFRSALLSTIANQMPSASLAAKYLRNDDISVTNASDKEKQLDRVSGLDYRVIQVEIDAQAEAGSTVQMQRVLAAGFCHSLGLLKDGTVTACGLDSDGQRSGVARESYPVFVSCVTCVELRANCPGPHSGPPRAARGGQYWSERSPGQAATEGSWAQLPWRSVLAGSGQELSSNESAWPQVYWEDHHIFTDRRGNYHILAHAWSGHDTTYPLPGCFVHSASSACRARIGHAFSRNAVDWYISPVAAATAESTFEDGETVQWRARERPHVVQDSKGDLVALVTGVGDPHCEGANTGVAGCDHTFTLVERVKSEPAVPRAAAPGGARG